MATKWGPGTNTGSGWLFYAGIEFSLSYPGGALDSTDTQVTVTTRARLRSNASSASGSNADYSFSGDQTGSGTGVSWSLKFAGDQEIIATRTQNVPLTSSTQSFDVTVGIQPSKGSLGSGWCYVTDSITIPARPVASPAAPTGLSLVRTDDGRQAVYWTNNNTEAAPYEKVEVWSNVDGGSFKKYTERNASSGFVVLSTGPNHRYGVRVRAVNDAGVSGWSNTDYISTTPDEPTAPPGLVPLENGDVRIYPGTLSVPPVVSEYVIEHAEDGVWDSEPLAVISKLAVSWVHESPSSSVTHSYRAIFRSSDPVLSSQPGPSATLAAATSKPNPPHSLFPDQVTVNASGPITVSWVHDPTDGSPQTKRTVAYGVIGGPWLTDGDKETSSQQAQLNLEEGKTYRIRVRTWGDHPEPSDWAYATITTAAPGTGDPGEDPGDVVEPGPPPTVTAVSPVGVVRYPSVSLTWEYEHESGNPQSRWWVEIEDDATGEVVASADGTNALTRSWTSPLILADGGNYTWSVRVTEPGGTQSEVASAQFSVQISATPQPPEIFVAGLPPAESRMHIDEGDHHVVSVFEKGGRQRLFDLDRTTLVRWSRKLDHFGEATVTLVPPFGMCGNRLSEIIPMRHELVIFYKGKRSWEGPITLVKDVPGQFTIQAKDVSYYLNRMVMRGAYDSRAFTGGRSEYTIDRLARIIREEGARFEDEPLPINVLPYLTLFRGEHDARTSRATEAGEKYVFDELDDLAWRGGIDFGVAGRRIYLMDTDTPVGEIRRLTSADFTSEVEVVLYGSELATEAYVTDRQGRWVSHGPGRSIYYGRVELVHGNYAETDDPEASAAVPIDEMREQASRDFAPRYPLPMTVRIPQNATMEHATFHELYDSMFPGVRVPLTAEGTVHNVSRMMKLKDLNVEEFEGQSTASVTLTPASEAAQMIGEGE